MDYNIRQSQLKQENAAEEAAIEQQVIDYEATSMGRMPKVAQLGVLGAQQTGQGIKDLLNFATGQRNDPFTPSKGWGELDNFEENIALSTGQRGLSDIGQVGHMARYIPDMLFGATPARALTPAAMLTGVGRMAKNKIRPRNFVNDMITSPGKAKAARIGGEIGEDILDTTQAEFFKGELREDTSRGVMDSFSPEALGAEVGFDLGIAGLMGLAKAPARRGRRNAMEQSNGYQAGAKKAENAFKQLGNTGKDATTDATVAELVKITGEESGPEGMEGFIAKYRELNQGQSTNTQAKPKKTAEAQPEAPEATPEPVKTTKSDTVNFKGEDPAVSTEDIIKSRRSATDDAKDLTLKNIEAYEKNLNSVDKATLSEAQTAQHQKRLDDLEGLRSKATELENTLVKERIDKMSDKQLRAARVKVNKNKDNKDLTESNRIYNDAVLKAFDERKPKQTVTFSDTARNKTDTWLGKKLSEREEFYAKENPKKEANLAIKKARNSDEYQTTLDEIIYNQNKAWADKNEGIKDQKKWKDLTINERRKIVDDFKKDNDLTVNQEVAVSDLFNENTDRMYRGNKKKTFNPADTEKRREEAFKKKAGTKAAPTKEEPNFEFNKEEPKAASVDNKTPNRRVNDAYDKTAYNTIEDTKQETIDNAQERIDLFKEALANLDKSEYGTNPSLKSTYNKMKVTLEKRLKESEEHLAETKRGDFDKEYTKSLDDLFDTKKADAPSIEFISKDGVKYKLHKNTDGSLAVMKGTDKVGIATNINEARTMANKHSSKTPEAQKKSDSSKESVLTPDDASRFVIRESKGEKGSDVKGEAATAEHLAKQTEGGKTPIAKVAPERFTGKQKDAMAFHDNGEVILRDWINGSKLLNHEILHSLLDSSYDNKPAMKKQTDAVMKEAYEAIDSLELNSNDKNHIKKAYKQDPQEMLVTVLSEPRYLEAFADIESSRPKTPTLLDAMVKLVKDIYDSVVKGNNNTLAHQMIDLMVMQSRDVAAMQNFNADVRNSLTTDSPLHKMEPMASKYVKGVASKTWKIINGLYNHYDKDSKVVSYLKDVGSGSGLHRIMMEWEVNDIKVLKSVSDLSDKMHNIDAFSRDKRGYTVQEIQDLLPSKKTAFGKQILVDEQVLADEIMGLDLQSLPKAALDRLIEADFSPAAMRKEQASLQKQMLAVMNKNRITRLSGFDKAMSFLTEQILGRQKSTDIRSYAVNNANMLAYNFTNLKGRNLEFERVLDAYVTMKAMSKRNPTEIKKLDKTNLKEIVDMHRHSVDIYKDQKSVGPQYRKGYIGGSVDPYWEYAYLDNETFDALDNVDGWHRIAYAEPGFTHARRKAAYLKYEKGAIPTNQYQAKGGKHYNNVTEMFNDLEQDPQRKGESVKAFNRRMIAAGKKKFNGKYEPYYDTLGKVTGFRVVMSDAMKRQYLGFKNKLSNSIANNIMDAQREVVYNKIVNQVNEGMTTRIDADTDPMLIKSITSNVNKEAQHLFLRGDSKDVRAKFNDAFLKKYYTEVTPEIRAILPLDLKGTAFVNKLYEHKLIGYRNEFLSDNRHLQLAEMWWRDMVIHFKESVIKKNPIAVMTNMVGNVIMLSLEGANPLTLATEIHKAKKDIDYMYKGIREVNRLELQLSKYKEGTKAHKNINDQIKAKQKELNTSEAHIGITEGWYQSAIDDIYTGEHSSASPIAKVSEATYRKMIEKSGVKSKATSDQITKAACDIFMTRHSRSGRAAEKFISYSDYTSRLVMYRLKRSQGMSKADATKLARDAFVDYRKQLPKELNALKVNGVIPFVTWAFRMQPVLARRALENPVKTAALVGAYGMLSEDMGYVGGARVGNWIPQTAFADPSIIGGIPKNIAQGEFPSEAIVPKYWEYLADGEVDKLAGVSLR